MWCKHCGLEFEPYDVCANGLCSIECREEYKEPVKMSDKIVAYGKTILCERIEATVKEANFDGIYLTKTDEYGKDICARRVIGFGKAVDKIDISIGDVVLVKSGDGTGIKKDNKDYFIYEEKEILCVVRD